MANAINPAFFRAPQTPLGANMFLSNGGSTGTNGFNLNPAPQAGSGPYGSVPGQLGLPNPAGDLAQQFPNLSGVNSEVSNSILDQLRGKLSPATIAALQDQAATFGVTSGMPGSGLAANRGLRDLGLATEQQVQAGQRAYGSLVPVVSQTQTVNPALQAEIAGTNASNAAAPNPGQAASEAKKIFDEYLAKANPAGATFGAGGGNSSKLPWWAQASNAGGGDWGPTAGSQTSIKRAPTALSGP